MAIEVVKQGTFDPNEQFHATCDRCGTVFNFLRKDGMCVDKSGIYCPRCHDVVLQKYWKKGKVTI